MDTRWTIIELIKWAATYFSKHEIDSPRMTAELLLAHIFGIERIDLYLRYDQPLLQNELDSFKVFIKRRIQREPVAYILQEKGFWSMDFKVSRDVLIPRPETETLVEAVLNVIPEETDLPLKILDLGTGSGAIIISLASERSFHTYFAIERSEKAIQIAETNAKENGLNDNISFICCDWFQSIKKTEIKFDIIVSNPPYIKSGDIGTLQPEICNFEPIQALDGGENGLNDISLLINSSHEYLNSKGHLFLEIGHDQRKDIESIITDNEFYDKIRFYKDLNGFERVFHAEKNNREN